MMKDRKSLLETLAEDIIEALHQQFGFVDCVTITVRKLHPPIAHFTGSVGVTLTRKY
jgi:dihydroneopterin aldolase